MGTSTIRQWIVRYNSTQSFSAEDNKTDNKNRIIESEVAVSDLTYVRIGGKWNYVCTLIDLVNRGIIGYSAGIKKVASLVERASLGCRYSLKDIQIFHSDRGKEYDNINIDNILETFEIKRSLSRKRNLYDNAVSEVTNKILKIEFIYQNKFETLEEL